MRVSLWQVACGGLNHRSRHRPFRSRAAALPRLVHHHRSQRGHVRSSRGSRDRVV